tara:strand:+ start:611 stop:1441 length:831 start_codon:yes stop_codon:yes gene_type:complete
MLKLSKKLIFYFNDLKNYLFQKIKYNKKYLYIANLDDIKKHEKNFYENKIKLRNTSLIRNTEKIDLNKITFDNSISLKDPKNPLVLTVQEVLRDYSIKLEETSIYKFFQTFRPNNLAELYQLDFKNFEKKSILKKLNQYTSFTPWFHECPQRFIIPGMFGPKDDSFPKSRFIRIKNLINLFKTYGYKPSDEDHISGYKMIYKEDYRFVITAGTHRVSVFDCLYGDNQNSIQLKFDDYRVKKKFQIINLEDKNNWPAVKNGFISAEEAEIFFLGFFK